MKTKLTELEFYKMCEMMEDEENLTNGYYPTVEELTSRNIEENIDEHLPLLTYFASDPFTKFDIDGKDDTEYKEMVRYVNKLLYRIKFKDDTISE